MNIEKTVEQLIAAKKAYYSGDKPIMTDAQFDSLEDELRKAAPENPYFKMVGWTENLFRKKITHPQRMRSMQKSHTIEDIESWIKNTFDAKFPEMIVEPKIDGLSMTIVYEGGRMQYAATRGDGIIGQDVTDKVSRIPGVLINIKSKDRIEVRGEVYLPKDNTLTKPGESLRSIASGIINRKDSGVGDCKHLRFVGYDLIGEKFTQVDSKLERIKELGFDSFDPMYCSSVKQLSKVYDDYIEEYRDDWKFESDGLIIQPNSLATQDDLEDGNDHHPKWAMAWKPPAEYAVTPLEGLYLRVTRLGRIPPKALLTPVVILNTEVKQATLHNWKFVRNLNLNRGDKIQIRKSGDVIPQVIANLSKTQKPSLLIPTKCPSCGHKLTATDVDLFCTNADCEGKAMDKIVYWVEKCEMDMVSASTVELLWNTGKVRKIADFYALKEKDLLDIRGIGESKAANLVKQIKRTASMTAVEFISRLGIPLIGSSGKALKKLGIKSLDDFRNFNDAKYSAGRHVIEWKRERANLDLVEELEKCIKITAHVVKTGKPICFTGSGPMPRKELEVIAEKHGYLAHDSVSKELSVLVCDDPKGSSSKLVKARKLGVKIMNYDDFMKEVGL